MFVRLVCTEKDINGEPKVRVAHGFEESHQIITDSSTGGKETFKIFLSIMISKNWICNSTDIKAAFLQGEIFRVVFFRPPKEIDCYGSWTSVFMD